MYHGHIILNALWPLLQPIICIGYSVKNMDEIMFGVGENCKEKIQDAPSVTQKTMHINLYFIFL